MRRTSILLIRDFDTDVFLECYEIFKNTYFKEHLELAASVLLIMKLAISTGHLWTIGREFQSLAVRGKKLFA